MYGSVAQALKDSNSPQPDYQRALRRQVQVACTETTEHHVLGPGVPILQLVCAECGSILLENLITGGLPQPFTPDGIVSRMTFHMQQDPHH